jgi:hypothetical protein
MIGSHGKNLNISWNYVILRERVYEIEDDKTSGHATDAIQV